MATQIQRTIDTLGDLYRQLHERLSPTELDAMSRTREALMRIDSEDFDNATEQIAEALRKSTGGQDGK